MLKRAHPFSTFLPPPLRALHVAISNTGPSYVRVLAALREVISPSGLFPCPPLGEARSSIGFSGGGNRF